MDKFRLIVRSGYLLLKLAPGKVALYIVLSFVTQTLIPVAFVPALLASVTNNIPHQSADTDGPSQKRNGCNPSETCNTAQTSAKPHIVLPYLEWLFLILALTPLTVWFRLAQNDLDSGMEFEMRNKMLANVLRQPPEFYRNYEAGKLSNIVTQMVTQAQQAFRSLCIEPLLQLVTIAVAIYLIVIDLRKMSGSVVWIAAATILLIGFFSVYIVQMKAKDSVAACQANLQQQFLDVSGLTTSMMSAPQDIQTMNAERLFAKRYGEALAILFKRKRRQILTMETVNSLLGFPTQLILGCLFGFVVYAVTKGRPGTDPGTVVAFSYLVPRLMEPFKMLAALGLSANSSWPAVELFVRLSSLPSRIQELPGAIDVDRVAPTLEARNVTFRYDPSARKVFDGASFEIPAGKVTGLVARFGQGKTTFFRLALRLYDPQEGEIVLGGYPTTALTLQSLRRQVSLMATSPVFFHFTVRENFLIVKPDATDDEIRRIAEKTGLWPILVRTFGPNPLDQQFAAGVALSGGERRKFSLSCSLLRDSVFVFFDEPSTNLSADELQDLISTIRTACAGKTVVVIDHILPSFIAPLCDFILVLENGSIVQRGTPQELLTAGGVFRELYSAQLPAREASVDDAAAVAEMSRPILAGKET